MLIVLPVGILFYALSAVFSSTPPGIVIKNPDPVALSSAVDKVYSALSIKKDSSQGIDLDKLGLGKVTEEELKEGDLNKILAKVDLQKAMSAFSNPDTMSGTLVLNKKEVNALIAAAFTAEYAKELSNGDKPGDIKIYDADFNEGEIYIKFYTNTEIPTPFGKYFRMEVAFIPEIEDHHLKLQITGLSVGDFNISPEYIKNEIQKSVKNFEESSDGKAILDLITTLKVSKNDIKLKYDFRKLSMILLNKLPEIEKLQNSPDKASELLKILKK